MIMGRVVPAVIASALIKYAGVFEKMIEGGFRQAHPHLRIHFLSADEVVGHHRANPVLDNVFADGAHPLLCHRRIQMLQAGT